MIGAYIICVKEAECIYMKSRADEMEANAKTIQKYN